MKNALITGITGQDGSYLAELLLEKGYNVMVSCEEKVSLIMEMSNILRIRLISSMQI